MTPGSWTLACAAIVAAGGAQGCILSIDDSLADQPATTGAGASDAGTQSALVAHWALDDGSGQEAVDSSGRGNTGTLAGAPPPQWTQDGRHGGALAFDGMIDQRVEIGNPPDLRLTGSMTISTWVKLSSPPTADDHPIVSKRGYEERGWQLYLDNGGGLTFDVAVNKDDYVIVNANPSPAMDEWYHAVAVYDADATMMRIYANGQLVSGTPKTPTGTPTSPPPAQYDPPLSVTVGRSAEKAEQRFPGTIDEVRIYAAALTVEEVAAIP